MYAECHVKESSHVRFTVMNMTREQFNNSELQFRIDSCNPSNKSNGKALVKDTVSHQKPVLQFHSKCATSL